MTTKTQTSEDKTITEEAKATAERKEAILAKVGTNSAKLPWGQDKQGITLLLRREGSRAIGRMGGRPERLALVIETLEILTEYAKVKFEFQNDQKVNRRKAAEARAAVERNARRTEAKNAIKTRLADAAEAKKEGVRLQAAFDKEYGTK